MQIKTRVTYHYIPIRIATREKNLTMPHTERTQSDWNSHTWLMAMKHGTSTLENSLVVSYQVKHTLAKLFHS